MTTNPSVQPLSLPVTPKPLSFDLQFMTAGQSPYGPGESPQLRDRRFVGSRWNEAMRRDFRIPNPFGRDPRFGFEARTAGQIGLQSDLTLNGGSINATLPLTVNFLVPDQPLQEGSSITLQTSFALSPAATLSAIGPTALYDLDLLSDFSAALNVSPGRGLDFDYRVNEVSDLIRLDSRSSRVRTRGPLGSLKARFPKLDTIGRPTSPTQIQTSVRDTFLSGSLDLDAIVTSVLGIPPLERRIFVDLGSVGDVDFRYNFLDAEAQATLAIVQNFSLASQLPATLVLEDGSRISFNVGDPVTFTVPKNIGSSLEVSAAIDFNGIFHNQTHLDFDFDLSALAGEFEVNLPVIPDVKVGPLMRDRQTVLERSFSLFDRHFSLSGFTPQTVQFQLAADSPPTNPPVPPVLPPDSLPTPIIPPITPPPDGTPCPHSVLT